MSDIERRYTAVSDFAIEERADQPPMIRGHAAVFNQLSEDLGGFREQIVSGAFAEAIQKDDVRALFNHDSNLILARSTAGTLRMAEDEHGLAVEIDPPDTQAARDLLVSMKRGDITQMSFGFMVRSNGQDWAKDDEGRYIRTLKSLRLFDVSPVTFPAYPQTDVAVRSLADFRKETEAPQVPWRRLLARRRLSLT